MQLFSLKLKLKDNFSSTLVIINYKKRSRLQQQEISRYETGLCHVKDSLPASEEKTNSRKRKTQYVFYLTSKQNLKEIRSKECVL